MGDGEKAANGMALRGKTWYAGARIDGGVYLVHLFQPNLISYTLVVDASRKLIIDSAEDFPMRLSESLWRKCGGEAATALRIGEVRKIVSQLDLYAQVNAFLFL